MPKDITKLKRRNAELEAAVDEIRNAWAHYHSVGGAVSRHEWVWAIDKTWSVIAQVWRPTK